MEPIDIDNFFPPLAPCPFCGGKNLFVNHNQDRDIPRWISCTDCEADGPPIDYRFSGEKLEALKIVADNWNRRMATSVKIIDSARMEDRPYWREPGYGEMGQ